MTSLSLSAALQRAEAGDHQLQFAVAQYCFERGDVNSARRFAQLAAQGGVSEAALAAARLELVDLTGSGRLATALHWAEAAASDGIAEATEALAKIRVLVADDAASGIQAAEAVLMDKPEHAALCAALSALRDAPELAPPNALDPSGRVCNHGIVIPESVRDWMVQLAKPWLAPAAIIDPASGQRRLHPVRRSDQAVIDWERLDPVAAAVLRLVAERCGCDWRCCEPINLLRYPAGGEYRLHHDCFEHDPLTTSSANRAHVNQRSTTAIIYLNDDFDGGATAFPALALAVQPVAGQLLQFANLRDDRPDPQMRHAGEPIRQGEKRILTFWFREHPLVERD